MRAVIQRVNKAEVTAGEYSAKIDSGLLVLLAVSKTDTQKDIEYMIDKTVNLRIISDKEGKLNFSVKDTGGDILAVPQFTLYGNIRKGRRPSFEKSAAREKALEYFNKYVDGLAKENINVKTGVFGEDMAVELINDGPVTIVIDSEI